VNWTLCCKEKDVSYVTGFVVGTLNEAVLNACTYVVTGRFFPFLRCSIFTYFHTFVTKRRERPTSFKIMFDVI
jgi:hypothetical protein